MLYLYCNSKGIYKQYQWYIQLVRFIVMIYGWIFGKVAELVAATDGVIPEATCKLSVLVVKISV